MHPRYLGVLLLLDLKLSCQCLMDICLSGWSSSTQLQTIDRSKQYHWTPGYWQLHTHFRVSVILNVEVPTVTVKCRIAIKALFLYFNLCPSVMMFINIHIISDLNVRYKIQWGLSIGSLVFDDTFKIIPVSVGREIVLVEEARPSWQTNIHQTLTRKLFNSVNRLELSSTVYFCQ
jgi:hypothetical protein